MTNLVHYNAVEVTEASNRNLLFSIFKSSNVRPASARSQNKVLFSHQQFHYLVIGPTWVSTRSIENNHLFVNKPFSSCFLPVFQNESSCEHSYENLFQLEFHFPVNQTYSHRKDFARELVRNRGTRQVRRGLLHFAQRLSLIAECISWLLITVKAYSCKTYWSIARFLNICIRVHVHRIIKNPPTISMHKRYCRILPITGEKLHVVFLSSPGHKSDTRLLFPLLHSTIYCSFCRSFYSNCVQKFIF